MKIGLIDVDSHAKKKKWGSTIYPNLALCKIAAWHKSKGDSVDWYDPMFSGHCDIVYLSKVFNFSPDYPYPIDADEIVKGGSGYDLKSQLRQEIDDMQPDLSIYPQIPCDTSYGFLTRGCPNKCTCCVVPRKEGAIRPYWDIERVANGRKNVILMDNNILAAGEYAHEQLRKIAKLGLRIDFNQGLDARLVTDEFAKELAACKWINRIRFGCDTKAQIAECERAMTLISKCGYKGEYFLYTIIGGKRKSNESEDDYHRRLFVENYERINHWWVALREYRKNHSLGYNAYPHAQPYRDLDIPNIVPQWQKDMAGWTNKRMLFCSTSFGDFEPRKGFKCQRYINKYLKP